MTNPTPRSVTVIRIIALAQALLALVLGGFTAVLTFAAYVSDRADAVAGHPDEWAGLGEFLGVVAAGLLVGAGLLIGLPALLLRPHRPGARIALIIGEVLTAGPLAAVLAAGAHHDPFQVWVLFTVGYLALSLVTVGLLLEPPARAWAADRGGCRPPDRDVLGVPTSPVRDRQA